MIVRSNTAVRIRPFNIAVAHVETSCTAEERKQIKRLKNGPFPIREWVSYVEPHLMDERAPLILLEEKRFKFDPISDIDIDHTTRGDRFILAGSLLWLYYIFEKTCKVNLTRFTDLEFHSALDTIGTISEFPLPFDKNVYARDPDNDFCDILDDLALNREIESKVHFDGKFLQMNTGRPKQPTIFLYWHSTVDNMFKFIQGLDLSKT